MLEIVTALQVEAEGLIRLLDLKSIQNDTAREGQWREQQERKALPPLPALPFPQYSNPEGTIRLTITGVGKSAAACAVGALLGERTAEERRDLQLVNFGSCALLGAGGGEGLYRIHGLRDADNRRSFYPDLLQESTLPEAFLVTGSRVWRNVEEREPHRVQASSEIPRTGKHSAEGVTEEPAAEALADSLEDAGEDSGRDGETLLYDMEGTGIYEAGSRFLGPHQLHFLKGVSDAGTDSGAAGRRQTQEERRAALGIFREKMESYAEAAVPFLKELAHWPDRSAGERRVTDGEKEIIQALSDQLHASVAMQHEIAQLVRYALLADMDVPAAFRSSTEDAPCRNRREGKVLLEKFRRAVLEQP